MIPFKAKMKNSNSIVYMDVTDLDAFFHASDTDYIFVYEIDEETGDNLSPWRTTKGSLENISLNMIK